MKAAEENTSNKKLIPFQIIKRASEGDIQAVNEVLRHVETVVLMSRVSK